jgi:hypothetical protein
MGSRKKDLIRIAPIKSAISYAVALREMGHLRGRCQQSPALAFSSLSLGLGLGAAERDLDAPHGTLRAGVAGMARNGFHPRESFRRNETQ